MVPDASEKIKYGSIIKEEDGSPIMVRRESMEARGLTSIWQDEVGLVYVLPTELYSQLDERLNEVEAGGAMRVGDDAGSDADVSDDEHEQDRATEQRATAAANQQTLLLQLQRGLGAQVELRAVPRTDYSGM